MFAEITAAVIATVAIGVGKWVSKTHKQHVKQHVLKTEKFAEELKKLSKEIER